MCSGAVVKGQAARHAAHTCNPNLQEFQASLSYRMKTYHFKKEKKKKREKKDKKIKKETK